jgi:hypothetical protein
MSHAASSASPVGHLGHLLKPAPREKEDGKSNDDGNPWRAIADVGSFNHAWTGAHRIKPSSPKLTLNESDVWASGLNPITGCGFGRDGSFYVTEFVTQESGCQSGDVVRIKVNGAGSAGARTALGVGALHNPNGFAAARDGSIYVSNNSISTAVDPQPGEVVRVNS